MHRAILIGFLLLLTLDTTSNVLIKLAGDRIGAFNLDPAWLARVGREPIVLAILGCYIAAFFTYTSILKHAPVGPAFAAVHGHVVTVLIVSMLWLGEKLTLLQAVGSMLVVTGIIVLAVTERMAAQAQMCREQSDTPV